ncbi:MAG: WYL domain-containing protein [Spirochaetota bacterium]
MNGTIDIFRFHRAVMDQYQAFSRSFLDIDDAQIEQALQDEGRLKSMWPDPLIQFNPSYEAGTSADALIAEGVLSPRMAPVFKGFTLHKHQEEALRLSSGGKGFVVTSGTGSGKSLAFLGTIFNEVFRNPGQGVTGLVVYPMNALINSQTAEIRKHGERYAAAAGEPFPVLFDQFTGQEKEDARERIRRNPPHILLTNYMMLELMLTRRQDQSLREAIFRNLKFLAFDELHTFRGRQGADVAMLIRRIKAECTKPVICLGTSATMAGGASASERKQKVAEVATAFFGDTFTADQVVEESLRAISGTTTLPPLATLEVALGDALDFDSPDQLVRHPLCMFEADGGLYLFVEIRRHGSIRILALERIRELKPLDDHFTWPEGFNLKPILEDPFGIIQQEPVPVVVRFDEDQAPYVRKRAWPTSYRFEDSSDGSLLMHLETGGIYGLKRWLLGWGSSAEVIEPAWLRDQMKEELVEALGKYGL